MLASMMLVLALQANPRTPAVPVLNLSKDDTLVTRSCTVVIPEGKVIADANGNGVLHIQGKGITVRFAKGSVLRGAPVGTPWDRLTGIGIRAVDSPGLVLSGLRVHGFKVGIQIERCDKALVEDLDVSDNFRQHLGSTPAREDASDWLYPHDNDDHEWRRKWGAALYLERCDQPVVRRVRVRRGQNAIILDRVTGAKVYDNDCSFLSGWGLALWRSSGCTITRNAFDFCVRGYSHGVYNRGQDSAGILMFEQCEDNFLAENSCTHGGDGFFGNSGKEALGQKEPGERIDSYAGIGNRRNTYVGNDFSYAAAHGFEQTFSFDEHLIGNRLVGNAICGIWGGYSQKMQIHENDFEGNGDAGYGLERGGINIEHGQSLQITKNRFVKNRCGIHLWVDADEGLEKLPWVKANPVVGRASWILANRFEGDKLGLHLRGPVIGVRFGDNVVGGVEETTRFEGGAELTEFESSDLVFPTARGEILGETRPVGARKDLRGRQNILMDEWGPWDHESPLLRGMGRTEKGIAWELYGVDEAPTAEFAKEGGLVGLGVLQHPVDQAREGWRLELMLEGRGPHSYDLVWKGKGFAFPLKGTILRTDWKVRVFSWKTDPRKDYAAWRKEADAGSLQCTLPALQLRYGMGGPRSLGLSKEITAKGPGSDHFGTIATASILLPAGTWIIGTQSDDGIRVTADGKRLIDDWTWHAPKRHQARLVLERERRVEFVVEHFELDGFSVLELEIRKAP